MLSNTVGCEKTKSHETVCAFPRLLLFQTAIEELATKKKGGNTRGIPTFDESVYRSMVGIPPSGCATTNFEKCLMRISLRVSLRRTYNDFNSTSRRKSRHSTRLPLLRPYFGFPYRTKAAQKNGWDVISVRITCICALRRDSLFELPSLRRRWKFDIRMDVA